MVGNTCNTTDFPTTGGSFQPTHGGGVCDGFVTKLTPAGSALVYSSFIGGSGQAASNFDTASAIQVDVTGAATVAGNTDSLDFPTTGAAVQATFGGGIADGFVAQIDATGSSLVYSTYLGGSASDFIGAGMSVDTATGDVYVTGQTTSLDFPTSSPFQAFHAGGGSDAFVTKLNATGSALIYSTYLGGSGFDLGRNVGVDASGRAHIAGETDSVDLPTADPIQAALAGGRDVFVTVLDTAGSAPIFSTYLGGTGTDKRPGLTLDSSGAMYVSGQTNSTDFPTTATSVQPALAGGFDSFVTKIDAEIATATPFAAFNVKKAKIEIDDGEFKIKGKFTLGASSDGIDPANEDVTFELAGGTGGVSVTIPGGAGNVNHKGKYKFKGTIGGIELAVTIKPKKNNKFDYKIKGENADLTGITNPATVALAVGDDEGSSVVTAKIDDD